MADKVKTVFGAGIFDMFHRGHAELISQMREEAGPEGNVVIVLHNDHSCFRIKQKFPVQSFEHRRRNLESLVDVTEVVKTKREDPAPEFESIIQSSGNDILYMRGDDLTENFPGKWMLDKYDIPIFFKPYTRGVSSSEMREKL